MTVHSAIVAANRAVPVSLASSNLLIQRSGDRATEYAYERMWAQDDGWAIMCWSVGRPSPR